MSTVERISANPLKRKLARELQRGAQIGGRAGKHECATRPCWVSQHHE